MADVFRGEYLLSPFDLVGAMALCLWGLVWRRHPRHVQTPCGGAARGRVLTLPSLSICSRSLQGREKNLFLKRRECSITRV